MKQFVTFQIVLFLFLIVSCEKDPMPDEVTRTDVSGFVQKGPFINGTDITVAELTDELSQTGKMFSSQIMDNKGTFEIRNIELTSSFVELKANGFYFNEVANENSQAQLTLFALADVTETSDINVNVFSNLEKNRVQYLVSNGLNFNEAKQQAQAEILSIFEIGDENISGSERLDISKPGDGNAALLAASVILQGYLSVAEVSELLANISTDIREDGVLNSAQLGTALINNARTIDLEEIRQNLENKYENLGLTASVPDFEKYVNQFIENTDFEFTAFIEYPPTGKHGLNLLDPEKTNYTNGTYSLRAILPAGTSLKVEIRGRNWMFPGEQEDTGWIVGEWNMADTSRIFTSKRTGDLDFEMRLNDFGNPVPYPIKIDVYENEEFTRSKSVYLN
ncbi:MAG: hypothetical protein K0B11_21830 [Mariniphaga sp.]|nr:hypothetical protein [Mariniphaga sp.]